MNINRNNYEEYFLLYADKELSADEKSMVEMFVKQNADLEEEFIMLQQSVLKPDAVAFENKNSLFRNEEFINQNNYEEKFLLYTDNELNLSEIEETEKFVLSNPALQNEFTLLQQVKYEADASIVFPAKTSLYKKERDDDQVIPFRWKAMAAAILLGIGAWTGISYLQNNKTAHTVATRKTIAPKEEIVVKPVEQKDEKIIPLVKTVDNQNTPSHKALQNEIDNPVKKQQQNVAVKNIYAPDKKREVKIVEQKNEDVAINDQPGKNEVTKPANGLPQTVNTLSEPNDKTITKATPLQSNNYAQPASYIADAEVKTENYIFYNITAEEFRKSKVGNFLKKVKRAVERKIPFKNSFKAELAKDIEN
ncbi:MAG: hypothetical protein JWO92_1969 [Chitinophagaceae bacterium]|nr:hypothetical protein [Chitinophagaceae bacterium]